MYKQTIDFSRPIRGPGEEFWIYLSDIPEGSIMTLQTETLRYDFRLLNAYNGWVEVLSHYDRFPRKSKAFILGSAVNRKLDPHKRLCTGYCVIFWTSAISYITTTPLVELQVNGRQILPVEDIN